MNFILFVCLFFYKYFIRFLKILITKCSEHIGKKSFALGVNVNRILNLIFMWQKYSSFRWCHMAWKTTGKGKKKKVARIAVNIYFSEEWRSIGSIASRIWSSLQIAEIFSYFEKKWILVINYRDLYYRGQCIYKKQFSYEWTCTSTSCNQFTEVNFQFISLFFSSNIYLRLIMN